LAETKCNYKAAFFRFSVFGAQAMVGVYHTILGASLPAMRVTLDLDLGQAGAFGSVFWLGFTVAILAGGVLADRHARHQVVMLGCWLMGLGSAMLGCWPYLWLNLVLICLAGGGTGVVTSSSTALVMGLHPGKEGFLVNVLHFFYALGTISGSYGMAYLLKQGGDWRLIYQGGGLFMLLLPMALWFLRPVAALPGRRINQREFLRLLKEPRIMVLILATLLGVGSQNAFSLWLVSFLTEARSFPIYYAGIGMVLFSAGMMAGRLIVGGISLRLDQTKLILGLFLLLNAGLIFLLTAWNLPTALVYCFITGLGFSGIFPLLLAVAGATFPSFQGTAVGLLGTAAGIGSTLLPLVISAVSVRSSLQVGIWTCPVAVLGATLLLFVSHKLPWLKKRRQVKALEGEEP
jgi:fucose permease